MKRKIIAAISICLFTVSLSAAAELPKSNEQKTLYAIGASLARSISVFALTESEFGEVMQGFTDTFAGKKADFDTTAYNGKIQDLAKARRKVLGEKTALAGREFLEKAASEKGAVKTDSGIVYIALAEGKGEAPQAADTVKVNYRGTLPDGKEFDSSYKKGKPLEFRLDSVIKCWTEGVQKMKPGGRARLICPAQMAYGDNGAGDMILPGATLAFEIELLEVKKAPVPSPVKPALPAAPAKPAVQ